MKKKVKLTDEGIIEEADNNEKIESSLKKSNTDIKAMFSQRLLAFIIDIFILSIITALIISFIPVNNTASKLYDEQNKILEDYIDGNYNMEDYVNKMIDIEYDISKYTVVSSLVAIVISLLYYVVYPCYNDGQTIGKKILKIKVKKVNDKELSMNDLLIRSMINNSILLNIICVILVLLLNKNLYLTISSLFNSIQYLIMFISVILIAFSKSSQGIHDRIVKTEVVMVDTVKEDVLCQIGN